MAVNWTNVTTMQSFLNLANNETSGWFWLGILGMIGVVLFITLLPFGIYPSFLAAAFASVVIGIFFVYMSLIGWQWVAAIVATMIAIFFWIGYTSSKYNQ